MRDIDISRMYENLEPDSIHEDDAPDEPISCDHCNNLAIGEYEVSGIDCSPTVERLCDECREETIGDGYNVVIREEF